MIIPKDLSATTKSGLNLSFNIEVDIEPVSSRKWVYHRIEAYTCVDDEQVKVGHLILAYISEAKRELNSKDILQYAINDKRPENVSKDLNLSNITIEDIRELTKNIGKGAYLTDSDRLDYFKMMLKFDHLKSYENHLGYHYLKPEPHEISVYADFQRKGIGLELYTKAIELCELNGLNFYQSTTQTFEANKIWEYMKKSFKNCGSYEYSIKGDVKKERFYFGTQTPLLNFDNELRKITIKRLLSKNKIKPI